MKPKQKNRTSNRSGVSAISCVPSGFTCADNPSFTLYACPSLYLSFPHYHFRRLTHSTAQMIGPMQIPLYFLRRARPQPRNNPCDQFRPITLWRKFCACEICHPKRANDKRYNSILQEKTAAGKGSFILPGEIRAPDVFRQAFISRFAKRKTVMNRLIHHCFRWLRRQDLNLRPSGYEPDELPDCSTPRYSLSTLSSA